MENRQQRTIMLFQSVLRFIKRYALDPEPRLMTKMRAALEVCLARLIELRSDQSLAAAIIGSYTRHVKRLKMQMRRKHMMPLVRIAKPLLKFAPGAERILRVPHTRSDVRTITTHAAQMAKLLKPHAKLIASAGHSEDLVGDFRKELDALAGASREVDNARKMRTRTTREIAQEIKKGMDAVMVIEGMMMSHYYAEKGILELWRGARRIPARKGRPPERQRTGQERQLAGGPLSSG